MFNQTASAASSFGTASTSSGLFGGNKPAGSPFGSSSNGSTPLFGGSGQNQNTQAQSGSLFGTQNASNANTSIFGTQSQQSTLSSGSLLFGQNQKQQGQNSLFGNNATAAAPQNSLFSNPSPIAPEITSNDSLFQKKSMFSVTSSENDAEKFKENFGGNHLSHQPSQANRGSLYPSISGRLSSNEPTAPLRHSQSSYTLGNESIYRRGAAPSWAQEKRFSSSQSSNLRHASSFSTTDRNSLAARKASPSQSPTNSFGSSFSGISKPSYNKKKAAVHEDPPPSRSIYDSNAGNIFSTSKGDTSVSLSRRRSVISNLSTPVRPSPRPVQTPDHSLSVVIFGFSPSVTPAVIAHFSRFGTIMENVDSSNRYPLMATPNKSLRAPPTPIQTGKNWLKITYDNPTSASRAIQENGVLIAGQYVVGCIPVTPHNHKEFEIASETSMLAGLRSPTESIGDYSIFQDTADFTDGNILPPNDSQGPEDHSLSHAPQNGKSIGRTISMPLLAGEKRVELKDGKSIFNKSTKKVRYSPSLFQISQEPDQEKKTVSTQLNVSDANRKLHTGKQGWMSWTSKKAQELVFGWDDL